MILNCPQCAKRFLVADRLIPAVGRIVRCGGCAHEWHVHNPNAEVVPEVVAEPALDEAPVPTPAEPEVAPAEYSRKVPVITKPPFPVRPFMIAVPALAAVWVFLAFFTYFPRWVDAPVVGAVYRVFGIAPTTGLAFVDVKMERETVDGKTRFILSGNIVNRAAVLREVPSVHVALLDANRNAIWTRAYPVHEKIKPDERYPFRIVNVETSFGDKVATITLDLGNSLQLMHR